MAIPFAVDAHRDRKLIIDALVAGRSACSVAKAFGISPSAVNRYRTLVILPAIAQSQPSPDQHPIPAPFTHLSTIPSSTPAPTKIPDSTAIASQREDLTRTSPVRSRLESLWSRTDRGLDKLEDKPSDLAPLINAGTRQVELLAKLTGELQAGDPSIAIQIVMPQGMSHQDLSPTFEATYETLQESVATEIAIAQKR
jgi:hypothetical protein